MSDKRRLAALSVILKAKQRELDRIAGELTTLRAQQSQVLRSIDELDKRRDTESYSASLEAQSFVVTFLQALAAERRQAVEKLSELDDMCAVLEEQVRDRFIELQKWRSSSRKLGETIAYEARRLENAQMDEIGNILFNQKN